MSEQTAMLTRCVENTVSYVEQLRQLSVAGIELLESYGQLMPPASSLKAINTLKQAINDIYEATSAAASQVKHDVELDLLPDKNSNTQPLVPPKPKILLQSLCRVFEVHQQYQQAVTQNLNSFTQSVRPANEAAQLPSGLSIIKSPSTDSCSSQTATNQTVESPKRVKKQVTSFFSKFMRPSQSHGPTSQFYVNSESDITHTKSESSNFTATSAATVNENNVTSLFCPAPIAQTKRESQGYSVSQEDLDNVINLLSGCPPISHQPAIPPYHLMNAPPPILHPPYNIHTPPPSHPNIAQPPPPVKRTVTPASVAVEPNRKYLQRKHAADNNNLTRKENLLKTNTWPNPSRQGAPQSIEDLYNTDPEYAHYLANSQCIPSGYGIDSLTSDPSMSMMMGPWPGYPTNIPNEPWANAPERLDSRLWATVDSSSCSDESSNSEGQWPTSGQTPQERRRHSSGEDGFHKIVPTGYQLYDTRPVKSVDDLMGPKLIGHKGMPPRHPWMSVPEGPPTSAPPMLHGQGSTHPQLDSSNVSQSQTSQGHIKPQEANQSEHRPLALHWSDPLANTKTWSTVTGQD